MKTQLSVRAQAELIVFCAQTVEISVEVEEEEEEDDMSELLKNRPTILKEVTKNLHFDQCFGKNFRFRKVSSLHWVATGGYFFL